MTRGGARNPDARFWRSRRVLLTGHTGFKGSWLACWLSQLGAEVHGFALEPPTKPNLFQLARVASSLASDSRVDLRDADAVTRCVARIQPEIVLHLAAQSLVRRSYAEPVATFATNVMGTVNLLDAAQRASVNAMLVVTSDKCYQDRGAKTPYREGDPLGGHDPYSASKACQELVAASWRASFDGDGAPRIASARAGNVIGAGDWATDRLIPDCVRAFQQGQPVTLRNPHAVRPWQHVLEPLAGYLLLAEHLCSPKGAVFARGWNFGPDPESDATVAHVAAQVAQLWGDGARIETRADATQPHETDTLRLDSGAARASVGWQPRWSLASALAATVEGYRAQAAKADLAECVRTQIARYGMAAAAPAPG